MIFPPIHSFHHLMEHLQLSGSIFFPHSFPIYTSSPWNVHLVKSSNTHMQTCFYIGCVKYLQSWSKPKLNKKKRKQFVCYPVLFLSQLLVRGLFFFFTSCDSLCTSVGFFSCKNTIVSQKVHQDFKNCMKLCLFPEGCRPAQTARCKSLHCNSHHMVDVDQFQ